MEIPISPLDSRAAIGHSFSLALVGVVGVTVTLGGLVLCSGATEADRSRVKTIEIFRAPICNESYSTDPEDMDPLQGRDTLHLSTGQYLQLRAVPKDGSGNALSVPLSWSSSSPSIAAVGGDGLVEGRSEGGAVLTAEAGGVTRSHRVQVMGTADRANPHEPSGFEPISRHTWTSTEEGDWRVFGEIQLVGSSGAPLSPPSVGRVVFPKGFDGDSPGQAVYEDLEQKRLYVHFAFRMSENWYGHRASEVNKIFFLWNRANTTNVIVAFGAKREPLQIRLLMRSASAWLQPNQGCEAAHRIERGQWHGVEVLARSNAPGASNGRLKLWLDGVKVFDYDGIQFSEEGSERSFSHVEWNPVFGGLFDELPVEQWMDMDHIYLSAPRGAR